MSRQFRIQRLVSRGLRLFQSGFLPPGRVGDSIRGDLLEEYSRRRRTGEVAALLRLLCQLGSVAFYVGPWGRFPGRGLPTDRQAASPERERKSMLQSILQDTRYAWRTFSRNRMLSLAVVLILGLGIGANTAIFAVVDAVLLRSLPFPEPAELVKISPYNRESGNPGRGIWSPPDFEDFEAANTVLASIAGYYFVKDLSIMNLRDVGEPVRLDICMVSRDFFSTLGSPPMLGRLFDPSEMVAGNDRVVVLSHSLWRNRFQADPGVIGRSYNFDGRPYQVIGVMPERFRFPAPDVQLWVPISLMTEDMTPRRREVRWMSMIGRLKPGLDTERAGSEAEAILQRLATDHPESNEGLTRARVTTLKESLVGGVRSALLALQTATALVLILAWANVGNLILARASSRGRELVVRLSLGASRLRLTRQLVTENLLLAAAGGMLGFGLALVVIRFLSLLSGEIPRTEEIQPDFQLLAFALGSALLTGAIFGLLPALRATQLTPAAVLREGGRSNAGAQGQTLRAFLLATEVALALMLAIACSLMLKTFWNLMAVDPGFQTEGVYRMSISVPADKVESFASISEYHRKMLETLSQVPGVVAAGGSKSSPLAGAGEPYRFTLIDADGRERAVNPDAGVHIVTPDYFRTLGVTLLQGRAFSREDTAPAGVINSRLAEEFFPGQNALEQYLNLGNNRVRIVGVADNVHHLGIQNPAESAIYLPYWYFPRTTMNYYTRVVQPSPAQADALRKAVWEVNPYQPIAEFSVLGDLVSNDLARPRLMTVLMVTFALLAVVLTALGIYGVVSYRVGQRTAEMGIRLALGASRGNLIRLVVYQSMLLCGAGILAGLAGAYWLSGLLSSLLYGVRGTDLAIFASATAVVLVVSLVASVIPARRATRVDPMTALRAD